MAYSLQTIIWPFSHERSLISCEENLELAWEGYKGGMGSHWRVLFIFYFLQVGSEGERESHGRACSILGVYLGKEEILDFFFVCILCFLYIIVFVKVIFLFWIWFIWKCIGSFHYYWVHVILFLSSKILMFSFLISILFFQFNLISFNFQWVVT